MSGHTRNASPLFAIAALAAAAFLSLSAVARGAEFVVTEDEALAATARTATARARRRAC